MLASWPDSSEELSGHHTRLLQSCSNKRPERLNRGRVAHLTATHTKDVTTHAPEPFLTCQGSSGESNRDSIQPSRGMLEHANPAMRTKVVYMFARSSFCLAPSRFTSMCLSHRPSEIAHLWHQHALDILPEPFNLMFAGHVRLKICLVPSLVSLVIIQLKFRACRAPISAAIVWFMSPPLSPCAHQFCRWFRARPRTRQSMNIIQRINTEQTVSTRQRKFS